MTPFALLVGLLLVLLGATLAFPVYQGLHTGGILYYVNGNDETSYLQYDFSRGTQSAARPGQFLVSLGHELGLSGGWLNAVFDALALPAFGLLSYLAFRRLGWSESKAAWGAAGLLLIPVAANCANPLVARVHDWAVTAHATTWLVVAEHFTPVIGRTPEPQFSLVLLALGVLVALWRRAFWPAYLVMPFMYPFVALPATFVLLACHLHARWPSRTAGPLLLAFLAVGAASALSYRVLVPPDVHWLMVDSHLPFVSFSGVLALALWALLCRKLETPYRFFALALALAPWAGVNQHVLSGHFAQPNNYEHYFGCFAIALVWILGTLERPRWRALGLGVGALCFCFSSYVAFRSAYHTANALPLTPELVRGLREHPEDVVIDDVPLASLASMTFPRQHGTALAFEKSDYCLNAASVGAYRCLKWRILHDPAHAAHFQPIFGWLDDAYARASADTLVAHMGRKKVFHQYAEVDARPCDPPPTRPLRYIILHP